MQGISSWKMSVSIDAVIHLTTLKVIHLTTLKDGSYLTGCCINSIEIFATKIVALLNRTAVRDLYDISNLQKYGIFDEKEKELLHKCVVFYSAIASEKVPMVFILKTY